MSGSLEKPFPGPLSVSATQADGELALWRNPPGDLEVLQIPPLPLGDNDIFGGDFDPANRWVDYAAGFVALAASNVILEQASGDGNHSAQIGISLEAATADPDLIIEMIRNAPLTDFHEMIVGADILEFQRRFKEYYIEGNEGLWRSLRLTAAELELAAGFGLLNRVRASRESIAKIRKLRGLDEAKLMNISIAGGSGPVSSFRPAQEVLHYILDLDASYVSAEHTSGHGGHSIMGSQATRERLERLMAVQYADAIRSRNGAQRPADIGLDVSTALLGRTDVSSRVELAEDPELLKLVGLRASLDAMWAEEERLGREGYTLNPGAPRDSSLNPRIVEMEALHAALEAQIILSLTSQQAREDGLFKLVSTIAGMEVIQTGRRPDRADDESGRILKLELGDYTEADFQRDVVLAGTVWRIIRNLRDERGLALFENTVISRIRHSVSQRTGQAPVIPERTRLAVAAAHFDVLAGQALSAMGLDGPIGVTDRQLQSWYRFMLAGAAARRIDSDGRYEQARRHLLQELGSVQRIEDFPGLGRMFCFYGDTRAEDGSLGILEAIAASNGSYRYLESAGNDRNNPMAVGANRAGLKATAARLGFALDVFEPNRTIPENYLCEAAHFIGRLPSFFTPDHILSILIPNGYATLSVESNRRLVSELRQKGRGVAQFSEVPTQIIRFIREPDGLLDYLIGHNDPNWKWPEHTLIIFRNKADGSMSDLYNAFSSQVQQAV